MRIRFSASAMTILPNVVAGTELKTPLKLPIGVRTALTMTACCFRLTGVPPMAQVHDYTEAIEVQADLMVRPGRSFLNQG
jgi:MFS-type transporter involved in bile tolerance (Atg22 family)